MSQNPARPKRAGEDFARTHHTLDSDDGPSSSKKPRFDVRNPSALAPDAPEKDAILDADEIGARGQKVRRNAVNIDGYDSDSENEGFDARVEAKARAAKMEKSKDEEEDDMFADLEEEVERDGDEDEDMMDGKKKKKAVRFLQEDEIEGQDLNSKSGGHVSADLKGTSSSSKGKGRAYDNDSDDSSSDSEVPDAERAHLPSAIDSELGAGSKKSHAPKLDAFNMKSEQEEGRFDESGNFVRKAADPDAIHDTWLEGLSKKDMKRAKEAAEKRDEQRRQKEAATDAILTSDLLSTLLSALEPSETVLETLSRLNKLRPKQSTKPKWATKHKNRKKPSNPDEDTEMSTSTTEESDPLKEQIEALTTATNTLLSRGNTEIYDTERELLARHYRRETGEDWRAPTPPPSSSATAAAAAPESDAPGEYEYKWEDGRDGGEAHGPYDAETMKAWDAAGYFGEGVVFRRVGGNGSWSSGGGFV